MTPDMEAIERVQEEMSDLLSKYQNAKDRARYEYGAADTASVYSELIISKLDALLSALSSRDEEIARLQGLVEASREMIADQGVVPSVMGAEIARKDALIAELVGELEAAKNTLEFNSVFCPSLDLRINAALTRAKEESNG